MINIINFRKKNEMPIFGIIVIFGIMAIFKIIVIFEKSALFVLLLYNKYLIKFQ